MNEWGERKKRAYRRRKLDELILFLFFYFLSLFFLSKAFCSGSCEFPVLAFVTIFHNLVLSLLVFWILKYRQEPFTKIGWTQNNLKKDISLGIFLFPPFYLSVILLLHLLTREGLSHMEKFPPALIPHNTSQIAEGLLMVMVVSVAEEIIFRGYLLTRIIEITGNYTAGILISSLLFAWGHVYEGAAGMATVFYIGVIYSLLFLKKKNLTVNIVLHFFTDFIPIVLVPILK